MKSNKLSTPKVINQYGIQSSKIFWNLSPNELMKETLLRGEGTLTNNGTLSIKTGKFTGRSPKDRYIVLDNATEGKVHWNDINQPYNKEDYDILEAKVKSYLNDKELSVQDIAACQAKDHQLKVRLIAEYPWSAHFVHNMFVRLTEDQRTDFQPDWIIMCAPGFKADPDTDNTVASNFSIINFEKKTILIGGTGYTGEIKKGIFSVLNMILPSEKNILSMHCSANVGKQGDAAVYFGLSGTGKTTLSADPERALIGDDEHGWSDDGLFNFEGGCYAKCIGLDPAYEPTIYNAIKPGAILENISFHPCSSRPNYDDASITQNTRVSYPLHHISNRYGEEIAPHPKNVFFLTCDAFGVLPPLSRLTNAQAMYYFMSGYTAKVAGTEEGVLEPKATFSACFGAPFLPLHPGIYADLLGQKIRNHNVQVWLVNTGWTSGPYGQGHRIALKHTKQLISTVLTGAMDEATYESTEVFGLSIPTSCPDIPSEILNPRNTWEDKLAYDDQRSRLAMMFSKNFEQYNKEIADEIKAAAPKVTAELV